MVAAAGRRRLRLLQLPLPPLTPQRLPLPQQLRRLLLPKLPMLVMRAQHRHLPLTS